jgi:signal peptidase I
VLRSIRNGALAGFGAVALLRVLRLPLPVTRCVVDGPSMLPAYKPKERLLVNRLAYLRRGPSVGDVVVIRDPDRPTRYLIKRVAAVREGDGGRGSGARYDVRGDNAADSRDSRHFGLIARSAIVGRAWFKY